MNRVMRAVRDLECGELYINVDRENQIHGFHHSRRDTPEQASSAVERSC